MIRPSILCLLLSAWIAGVSPARAAGSCATADYCPVKITNDSKVFGADEFQVLVVVQNDAFVNQPSNTACQGQTAAALICPPAYVQFDGNGVGTLVAVQAGMTSLGFAKRLSDFPRDPIVPNTYVLQMPRHGSGRFYVTIGESVTTSVIGTAAPFSISDPSVDSARDPNYYKIFDKFESSFLHKANEPLYINTTSVDFVSMPLSLTMTIPGEPTKGPVGYVEPRQAIFSTLATALKDGVTLEWQKLVQTLDGNPMRVIAPNKALLPAFDTDYFKAYIKSVWDHYKVIGNRITIDATEVLSDADRIAGKTLTYTANVVDIPCAIEVAPTPTCGPYADALNTRPAPVTALSGALCFTKNGSDSPGQPTTVPVIMPTGNDMIAADKTLCAPNKTSRSIIARDLSALLNRGLLPIPGSITVKDTDKTSGGFWAQHASSYYTNMPAGRPNFNLYAKVLHALSIGGVYAFAFDDVGGADSTLVDTGADAAIVTINDMTGTRIPDPRAADSRKYSVTFGIPNDQVVTLVGDSSGPLANGAFRTNLMSPIKVVWGGHPLAIFPRTGFISPAALGNRDYNIVVNPDPGDPSRLTIAFPGKPASGPLLPDPWPAGNVPTLTLSATVAGSDVHLAVGLVPNDYTGVLAECFLVAMADDGGLWWYNAAAGTWSEAADIAGLKPAYTGLLQHFSGNVSMPDMPEGTSRFIAGVDTTISGGSLNSDTFYYATAVATRRKKPPA